MPDRIKWVPEEPGKMRPLAAPGFFAPFEDPNYMEARRRELELLQQQRQQKPPLPSLVEAAERGEFQITNPPIVAPGALPTQTAQTSASVPSFMLNPDVTTVQQMTPTPTAAPPAGVLDGINPYLKALQEFFPNPPTGNLAQQKADANAESEKRRTALLAQLAFASGLTSAGGGSWKEMGQGFAAAGQVYDQGFERYQAALQDSADRMQKQNNTAYETDIAKREAALKLYSGEKSLAADKQKEQSKLLMDSLELLFPKPGDEAAFNPEIAAERERKIARALHYGVIPFDVSD